MDPNTVNSFFTQESLLTFQAASLFSMLVPTVLRNLMGSLSPRLSRWTAFGVAMLISLLVASQAATRTVLTWIVAVFNGFLVYWTALGLNETVARQGPSDLRGTGGPVRSWF